MIICIIGILGRIGMILCILRMIGMLFIIFGCLFVYVFFCDWFVCVVFVYLHGFFCSYCFDSVCACLFVLFVCGFVRFVCHFCLCCSLLCLYLLCFCVAVCFLQTKNPSIHHRHPSAIITRHRHIMLTTPAVL